MRRFTRLTTASQRRGIITRTWLPFTLCTTISPGSIRHLVAPGDGLSDHVWSLEEIVLLANRKAVGYGKASLLTIAVLIGISAFYDFYRGYHQGKSIAAGVLSVIFGFCILALFWLLFSRRNSN
jgi:hypothetical protein